MGFLEDVSDEDKQSCCVTTEWVTEAKVYFCMLLLCNNFGQVENCFDPELPLLCL